MKKREYSDNIRGSKIFLDLLKTISRRGWYGVSPVKESQDSLLFIKFHIHPQDADYVYNIITKHLNNSFWVFYKKNNRFSLYPKALVDMINKLNDYSKAFREVDTNSPEVGIEAAADLIVLSDKIFEDFKANSKE